MGLHLVRYGLLGHVGRFAAVDALRYPRRAQVVVRSPRGLEAGEVLAEPQEDSPAWTASGQILRGMTTEDHLLAERLQRRRHEAFGACCELLQRSGREAALVDVEHLLDGRGLIFYFLGEPPAEARELMDEMAEAYDAAVEFRKFADALTEGCGPGCGTEEAKGQGGCSTCSGCAVSGACGVKIAK